MSEKEHKKRRYEEKSSIRKEHEKTELEKAEDIAYTINHSILCMTTDFLDPPIGRWIQSKYPWMDKKFEDTFGFKFRFGHSHDHEHGHGHDHDHDHHHHEVRDLHWWIGEIVGDFAAVPITVMTQRYAPGFMRSIRDGAEPLVGKVFHKGAEHAAKDWAENHGFGRDSDERRQYQDALYEYEMDHLPQAVVWTGAAYGFNIATQKLVGNKGSVLGIMGAKGAGSMLTAAFLVGFRGLTPAAAHKWDRLAGEHVVLPVSKAVGKVFGIDHETMERVSKRGHGPHFENPTDELADPVSEVEAKTAKREYLQQDKEELKKSTISA